MSSSRQSTLFLAGASGVIGVRLLPLLQSAGYRVIGATRTAANAALLRRAGAIPVVVDVFDALALSRLVSEYRPEVVIHQLTDLPDGLDANRMAEAIPKNARIRSEGTRNLVAAARAAGVRRLIAQSIAWSYAPGPEPRVESDPLNHEAQGMQRISLEGVMSLERQTLESPPIEGVVLRYGHFYGPGTGCSEASGAIAVHVDAAASAALLAIRNAKPGVYNIADDNPHLSVNKARSELGWNSAFRGEHDMQNLAALAQLSAHPD